MIPAAIHSRLPTVEVAAQAPRQRCQRLGAGFFLEECVPIRHHNGAVISNGRNGSQSAVGPAIQPVNAAARLSLLDHRHTSATMQTRAVMPRLVRITQLGTFATAGVSVRREAEDCTGEDLSINQRTIPDGQSGLRPIRMILAPEKQVIRSNTVPR